MSWRRTIFEGLVRAVGLFAPSVKEPPAEPRSIFVLRNNDIGDLLVITPLFEALGKKFPKAEIIAGIGSWNRDVLVDNPNVSRILEINAPWHNQFVRPQGPIDAVRYIYRSEEVKALQQTRPDFGIDVLGSGFGSLLMMRARIPYRLGVRGYAGGDSAVHESVQYDPTKHVGHQALQFARLLGCEDLPENRPQIFLPKPPRLGETIVIAPGAGRPEKAWPGAYFAELVRLVGPREKILVIGSEKERDTVIEISAGNAMSVGLSLRESFEIIASARLVICNSSMAMHAAAAFRRPAVVLLGKEYVSASQHRAQWGYPETVILGKDRDHPEIFTPGEVLEVVRAMLGQLRQQECHESEESARGIQG